MIQKRKENGEKKTLRRYEELEKEMFKGGVTIIMGTRNPHEVLCEGIADYVNQIEGRVIVRVKKRESHTIVEE